jgi:hypothetical protein
MPWEDDHDYGDEDEEDYMTKGDKVTHKGSGLKGVVDEYDQGYVYVILDGGRRAYIHCTELTKLV